MFPPNYVRHSCNDGIPFELFIASNRGTNSVLLSIKIGYLQCLDHGEFVSHPARISLKRLD